MEKKVRRVDGNGSEERIRKEEVISKEDGKGNKESEWKRKEGKRIKKKVRKEDGKGVKRLEKEARKEDGKGNKERRWKRK